MKQLFLLVLSVFFIASLYAQDDITVCHTTSTEKFAMLASNENFNKEHQMPHAYIHVSEEGGKMIRFRTPAGQEASGYLLEAKNKTSNWIIVFQEWWGLNDNVKRESEALYKDLGNVNVIAVDMYDGKQATDRETAGRFMQEFKQERGDAIIKGALDYAGKDAKIGTVGWCFGGGQSLLASLLAGDQAAACVIYYGMPVDDVSKLKTLKADVLGIFATLDQWINPQVVRKFEQNMKSVGKNITIKNYHADHGFSNPSNSIFDKQATEDAYKTTLAFFKARLN